MTAIDTAAFKAKVTAEGYQVFDRTLVAGDGLDLHTHDFDVWGLVLSGAFTIAVDGVAVSYEKGQEFQLDAGCPHSESVGPEGATFIVGRRAK